MTLFSDVLLTVDYDRTLTGPDAVIPERNIEAILYFMENGGTFTVNTGRGIPMSLRTLIPNVPVNAPLLLYNGSAAYDVATGELSQVQEIPVDPRAFLEDLTQRFPMLQPEIQGVDAHYLLNENVDWEIYNDNNHFIRKYATWDKIPLPFIKVALNGNFREHTIAYMYREIPEEMPVFEEAIAYLQEAYGQQIEVFRPCTRILDLHAKGCSKLAAARKLQETLGKKILVCVGDAENDLTMLSGADYAFCPSDGRIADRFPNVCPCAEGAVADVIYEKIPAILENRP